MLPDPQSLAAAVAALRKVREEMDPKDIEQLHADQAAVYERFQPVFEAARGGHLDIDAFCTFMLYENNRHWRQIHRHTSTYRQHPAGMREAAKLILDESLPLQKRIMDAREQIKGLGPAVVSPMLHVAYPHKYGVLNRISCEKMKAWNLWDNATPDLGQYEAFNAILQELSRRLECSLWDLDTFVAQFSPVADHTPTYLLTWNPTKYVWPTEEMRDGLQRLDDNAIWTLSWSTGNTKRINPDDRFYLLRLGQEPKGIVASGCMTSSVSQDKRWDDPEKRGLYVDVRVDEFSEAPLSQTLLVNAFNSVTWSPQGSGPSVDSEILVDLERMWQQHLQQVQARKLPLVGHARDILHSMDDCDALLDQRDPGLLAAVERATHFVYDPPLGQWVPLPWAGFRGMTAEVHQAVWKLAQEVPGFRGFTRERALSAVETLTGGFQQDAVIQAAIAQDIKDAFGSVNLQPQLQIATLPCQAHHFAWLDQSETHQRDRVHKIVTVGEHCDLWRGDVLFCSHEDSVDALALVGTGNDWVDDPGDDDYTIHAAAAEYFVLPEPLPLAKLRRSVKVITKEKDVFVPLSAEQRDAILEHVDLASLPDLFYERLTGLKRIPKVPAMPSRKPLNQIFFGPPGTGKTYATIAEAVRLCDEQVSNDRSEVEKTFERLRSQKRVALVTFHASYGYEDFVEGLRPKLDGEALGFRCVDGIFRQICRQAATAAPFNFDPKAQPNWKMSLGDTSRTEDAAVFDEAMATGQLLLGYGEGKDFVDCDSTQKVQHRLSGGEEITHAARTVDTFKNRMSVGDFVFVSQGNLQLRAIGRVVGPYGGVSEGGYQRRQVQWLQRFDQGVPIEKVMDRRFSQNTLYSLHPGAFLPNAFANLDKPLPHVLIIDEINRANVAKVFGDLMTLIEDNKRLGETGELRVTLPYSQEEFGVPNNLHIIGTMNTADRSVAFLDMALRRRFRFREFEPDATLLRDRNFSGISLQALLQLLNDRIEELVNREHRLGHSYFLPVQSLTHLRDVFVEQIIPLLQEYFYDDWPNVRRVLRCEEAGSYAIVQARELQNDKSAYALHTTFRQAQSDTELQPFFASLFI